MTEPLITHGVQKLGEVQNCARATELPEGRGGDWSLLGLTAAGLAAEAKPGEEVTVTLTLQNTDAAYVRVLADYDKAVFDLVSYSAVSGTAGGSGLKGMRRSLSSQYSTRPSE